MPAADLFLTTPSASRIRAEIVRAGDNEVCFIARVAEDGAIIEPRVVARGNRSAVLAAAGGAEAGMLVLHNHPSGELEPSDADFRVAAELHDRGLGLAIVDNAVTDLYVVVEPGRARSRETIDPAAVEAVLEPGGALAREHRHYEDRPTQRAMAAAVAARFNDGGVLLAEAGTGTGKSVAYLVPALRWAIANRERVIISTNTINLQEQLVGKDLPLLRRAMAEPFRFALVKGRGNYVSIRRAKLAAESQSVLFEDAHAAELHGIAEWLETTSDGSLQDLPFQPSAEVWDEVVSDTDACLRAKCPHYQECFYQRARRAASTADLLVVNHSLLLSDIAVRRVQGNYTSPAVLPPYRQVIIDEAHNLEDAATEHLGARISRRGLVRLLGRLDRKGKGILGALEAKLRTADEELLQQGALRAIREEARPAVAGAREHGLALFRALEQLALGAADGVVRLDDSFAASDAWSHGIDVLFANATLALSTLATSLGRLREQVQLDRQWADALAEQLLELGALAARVREAEQALRTALLPSGAAALVR
ncbi:MAG: JAB domain-containing protein, partial [Longimicrobiales bacterium]